MPESLVVISRAPSEVAGPSYSTERPDAGRPLGLDLEECRRFEREAAAQLADAGCRVLIVPHLYHLWAEHQAVERVAATDRDLIVGSWLAPRPAYWCLRAHGVDESREIACLDLRAFDAPGDFVAEVLRQWPDAAKASTSGVDEIVADAAPRWYPVLDYGLCASCKQCHEFCMFGVYSIEEGRVVATQPDNCKPGCPACARVCPKAAIMFPHYLKDPGIAGEPGAAIAGGPIDVDAFFKGAQAAAAALEATEADAQSDERDDLDDLIDRLDEMDQ